MDRPVEIGIGQVLASLPFFNCYQVNVRGVGTRPGIAAGSGSDRLAGHRSNPSYLPGAYVVVAFSRSYSESRTTELDPVLILGAWPVTVQTEFTGAEDDEDVSKGMQWPSFISRDSKAAQDKNIGLEHVITADSVPLLARDSAYGRLQDAGPGDWYKNTPLGGMAFVSDFMSRLLGSPDCGITAHYLQDMLEFNFRQWAMDGDTWRREWLDRGNTSLQIEGRALNMLEGMGGSVSVPALKQNEETGELELVQDNQAALWRELNLGGGDVEGLWAVTRAPMKQDEVVTRDTQYYGLVSEQKRFDGVYRVQAAKEIRFEKTLEIRSPEEKKDVRTQPRAAQPPTPPSEELWETLGYDSYDEMRAVDDIVFRQQASWEELNVFNKGLRQDAESGIWELPPDDEIKARLDELVGPAGSLSKLGSTQQEYTLADVVAGEVEVMPGEKVKLFRNSSVFLMEDDGGFVLGDGYGGEIRMRRGVVEIGSIGDIRVRAGRDVITMAPGNLIQKAGQHVETTSTDGSIVQKAEKNMHLLSGNGGSGSTILENRSTQGSFNDAEDEDTSESPLGAGVVLKSAQGGVAMLGSKMYFGGMETGQQQSKDGTEASCDIVVNTGRKGSFTVNADRLALLGRTSASLSLSASLNGVFIDQSNMVLASENTIPLVCQRVHLDEVGGSMPVPTFEGGRLTSENVNASTGPPDLVVQGSATVRNSLGVGGGIRTTTIESRDGTNGEGGLEGRARSNFEIDVPASQAKTWGNTLSDWLDYAFGLYEDAVQKGWATDYGHKAAQLRYPDSDKAYRAGEDWQLLSLRWQTLLDNPGKWEEKPVADAILGEDRYPYPGTDKYTKKTDKGPYRPIEADGTPQSPQTMDEYPVNV